MYPALIPILLIVAVAVCRGASFLFIKFGVESIPVFTLVFLRVGIAALILIAYIFIRHIKPGGDFKSWCIVVAMGVVGNVIPFSLVSYAERSIDSGLAGLLIGMVPMFVFILAFFFAKDEVIDKAKILGVVSGLIGLAFIYYPEISVQNIDNITAVFATLLAAAAYAAATIFAKKVKDIEPEVIAAAVTTVAAIVLIPAVIFENPDYSEFSAQSWYATIALGIVSTAIPFVIMYGLIAAKGATYFTMNNYLIPLVALVLGAIFANEVLSVELVVASIFIFVGIYLCVSRRFISQEIDK